MKIWKNYLSNKKKYIVEKFLNGIFVISILIAESGPTNQNPRGDEIFFNPREFLIIYRGF